MAVVAIGGRWLVRVFSGGVRWGDGSFVAGGSGEAAGCGVAGECIYIYLILKNVPEAQTTR